MTLAAWGGLAIAWLAGIVTPGPDVLVVLRLGVLSARGGIAQLHAARSGSPDVAGSRVRRPFLLGVTTNLASPKALVFYTALLSQFLPAHAGVGTQLALIGALAGSGVVWFASLAVASSGRGFAHGSGARRPGSTSSRARCSY